MAARRTTLSAAQQRAIEALLVHASDEEAARAAKVPLKLLRRWMREQPFNDALLAALSAECMQSLMRLRQGMASAAVTILRTMQSGATPARRLRAARKVIREAPDALAMQMVAAEVEKVEKVENAGNGALPANQRSPRRGHGSRLPRLMDQAVTALLTERTVAAAARKLGVARSTLCHWLELPEFQARYRAAARTILGPATRILVMGLSHAVSLVANFSIDPSIPEATRLEAATYRFSAGKALEKEDLEARMAALEPAAESSATSEPAPTSPTLGRVFYQRLQRLKAVLSPADRHDDSFAYFHAEDGRPTGSVSVRGPDGRQIWLVPPDGSKAGEPVAPEVAA
jgi:hypothetical protein